MKIVIHDYTAFSFPVQLSRELASRGHEVLHLYSDFDPRGGRLQKEASDPDNFQVEPVSIGEAFNKYGYVQRVRQENSYARVAVKRILAFKPDVIFNSNTSITISKHFLEAAHKHHFRYVNWTQDIYSLAVAAVLPKKYGVVGSLASRYLHRVEQQTLNRSDAVIVISDDFKDAFKLLKIQPKQIYTIPNWMPLDEMTPEAKVNPWSTRHGLDKTLNIMYVGTLSFKHDHGTFVELAKRFADQPEVRIVVVGAGIAFDSLKTVKENEGLENLLLFGWQKYEELKYVFSTGDILMAAIAPHASQYSVPCKVLSYLSSGRPVLAAIPEDNLMHRLLVEKEMGLAAHPENNAKLLEEAQKLVSSKELRDQMATNGRAYAEATFNIKRIGDEFETIAKGVTKNGITQPVQAPSSSLSEKPAQQGALRH